MEANNVRLENSKVNSVETWVAWNGTPWPTIVVQRLGDNTFESQIGDPEHGGGSSRGTLQEVLRGLHPNISARYEKLFSLESPTPEAIAEAGFEKYTIV